MPLPLVFLSHSGADTESTRELKRRLLACPDAQKAGLKVWFDKDDLRPGEQWQPQIEQAIEKDATAFLVYVGSRGVINWVDLEVRTALSRAATDKDFLFIPVLAPDIGANALPPFARLYQGVGDPLFKGDELERLLKAVLKADWDTAIKVIEEPFVGLRAMREEESDRFFGREAEIDELAEKFRKLRLVAIVADSGTGKSSLARAGFAPAFRGGALIDPIREDARDKVWQVVTMRPRADPAEGLRQGVEIAAQTLGRSLADLASLRDSVSIADAGKTAFALRCGLPPDKTSTLLIVDQLEELFTATPNHYAAPFAALLLSLAAGPSEIRILLTVRSDYFNLASGMKDASERPALFERLTANNNDAILRLKAMSPTGLREAVLEPLKRAGETNETALADAVQTDISNQASDLPLLQVALRAAWQRHHPNGPPMLECYQSVGRVSGALANEADAVLGRLPPDDQARLESIFVRLVRLGDTGGATRRAAALNEFDEARRDLLQRLGSAEYGSLVAVGQTTAEIAHEALITQWPWLAERLNSGANDVRGLDRLITKAPGWAAAATVEKPEYLAYGAERQLFNELAERRPDWLSATEKKFVAASNKAHQDELNAARAIARRNFMAAALAIAFAIAAGIFAYYAQHERSVADEAAQNAEHQKAIADENANSAADATKQAQIARDRARVQLLAMQARRAAVEADTPYEIERAGALALESIALAHKINRPIEPDAVEASRGALARLPLQILSNGGRVESLAVLADGRLASGGDDGKIKLWPKDGQGEPVVLSHGSPVRSLAVLADGRLASGGDDGKIKLWPRDGVGEPAVLSHDSPIQSLAVLTDGRMASGGVDGKMKVWPHNGQGEPMVLSHGSPVGFLAVLADGRLASSGEFHEIKLWPRDGVGEPVVLPHKHNSARLSLVVLADGRLASGDFEGQITLWPRDGVGEPVVLLYGGRVKSLAMLTDGRLASGGVDGKIKLWPKDGHGEPITLSNGSAVWSLVVLADGRLASGGSDGQIKLSGRQTVSAEPTIHLHDGGLLSLAVLADGRLVSGGVDGKIKLWPKDGQGEPIILSHGSSVLCLAVLLDGRLASGGYDGTIKLWPKDGQVETMVLSQGSSVWSLAVLADGRLASGGDGGQIQAVAPRMGRVTPWFSRMASKAEYCLWWHCQTGNWPVAARTATSSPGREKVWVNPGTFKRIYSAGFGPWWCWRMGG